MKIRKILSVFFTLAFVASAFAAPINLKIGSVCPDNSPWSVEQKRLAKEWAEITNGEVTLTFLNATALGGEKGVIQKMKIARPGQKAPLDGGIFTNIGVYELAPESHVLTFCLPFMFKDQGEIDYVFKETEGHVNKAIEDQGFEMIGWFNVGMIYFFTKEEVRTVEKLKSVSLSVGGVTSPELGKAFQHAGYTTSDVSNEKMLSSLKSATGCGGLYTIPMYAYA
nr:TRAP transporter substrate-binding protein DctP [Treponemataceae bacterium]